MALRYLILTVLLWGACRAQAFDLDSLLVKSVGGKAAYDSLKSMTSYTAEGSVSINGNAGTFKEIFVPPQKLYIEINLGELKLAQALYGTNAWQRDQNGSITSMQGIERDELLEQVYFESYAYLFPDRVSGRLEYRGDTVYHETPVHVVVFTPEFGGDSIIVYFDVATGLRLYVIVQIDNTEVVTTVSDYRTVQGVLVPFQSKAMSAEAPISSEFYTITSRFNSPVDTMVFQQPANQVADFHFPVDQDSVRIHFKYHAGHIYVPVTVNGTTRLMMILDSGASANMLHEEAVAGLKLPSVGTIPAKGLANYQEISLVRVDSMAIGELRLYRQVSGLLDLGGVGFNSSTDSTFGGILGYDFLSRFPIMLDYADSVMIVYNPARFTPPAGGTEVPFHLTMQVPTVEMTINNVAGDFIIDLGNAFGLILHQSFTNRPEVTKTLRNVEGISSVLGGVGGDVQSKAATVDSVVIAGRIHLANMRVVTMASGSGLAGSEKISGNVGNLVLQSFSVLFDYSHERLIFYPADTHP